MNHNISDERIDKINEWMKTVSTITSGFKSLKDENDPLTEWDSQYYTVVKYNDGREDIQYSTPSTPSTMLHEIDEYLKTWGLNLSKVENKRHREGLLYTGISFIRIEFNTYHKDMIKFDNHNWFDYSKERFQYLIYEKFLSEAEKNNNLPLMREIKLRNLLA